MFRERERKSEKVILRLTKRQKERTAQLAQGAGVAMNKYVIALIGADHERELNEKPALSGFDTAEEVGDGMPF